MSHKAVSPGAGEQVIIPMAGVVQSGRKILSGREDSPFCTLFALDQLIDSEYPSLETTLGALSSNIHYGTIL